MPIDRGITLDILTNDVLAEAEYASTDRRFPSPSGDPVRGVALITEEVGEAMKEALDLSRGYTQAAQRRMRRELIQVAATAVQMLTAMETERREG